MNPVLIAFAVLLGIGVTGYFFGFNPIGEILGTRLAAKDIAIYAANAGFSGDALQTAVAIALAESGGDPKAHGDLSLPGSGSYGLWQIYAKAHPEFGPDFTALYDPQTNANAAFQVYATAGASFYPWSTYKNDAYLAFLDRASEGINA